MSSQNAFPGRPAGRPANPTSNGQPSWVHPQAQTGRPQQPANNWPPQQQPAPAYPSFPQPGYGNQSPEQQPPHGQWSELQPPGAGNHPGFNGYPQEGSTGQSDPYAPQFEPYVPPSRPNYGKQPQPAPGFAGQQQQSQAPQWPSRGTDPRGFDAGSYAAPSFPAPQSMHPAPTFGQQQYQDSELSAADWAGPHDNFARDPFQQNQGDPSLGFGQAEGGELEPVYGEEEGDYEYEDEAPRGRRPIMILAALVGAIVIGGGMAYGYKKLTSGHHGHGDPPIIKSDDFASKTKPADAGGKQFPYSDTKIMGRLGDGTSSASASDSSNSQQNVSDNSDNSTNSSSVDDGGARKVSTLVVGRDGSIQPPATPTQDQGPNQQSQPSSGATGVPGTSLVDVFGQQGGPAPAPAADSPPQRPRPVNAEVVSPPKKMKPVRVAKVNTINASDASNGSSSDSADTPSPSKKKYKKVARAEPTVETDATADAPPVVPSSSGGGTGFVAVLASVPHSSSSRIDALKRFADMQQKYSTALAGKTPDIASANLSKGAYDRLIVGPPGSREEASNVCSQLKAQGYKDCWVTSY
jgi:hypothetical protein